MSLQPNPRITVHNTKGSNFPVYLHSSSSFCCFQNLWIQNSRKNRPYLPNDCSYHHLWSGHELPVATFPKAILRSILVALRYGKKKPEDTVEKFQVELNKQFQYIQFDIINQYANYILLAFVASFYAYLIPITIPILAVVFFLQFWVDKLNLFKRCSHPRSFSFYLTRNILKIFEACIWIFAVGTCIFAIYVHQAKINILNLITLGIASLYIWFLLGASIKL